jgi:hypothetical protein
VVALVTRQNTVPAGSGCGGCADDPLAANETITFWQARSRQMSTVAPVLALSPSQLSIGRIDVEIDVDSGAMRRGAVRGDGDPATGVVVGGSGVGVGVGAGAEVEVEVDGGTFESDPDDRVSGAG